MKKLLSLAVATTMLIGLPYGITQGVHAEASCGSVRSFADKIIYNLRDRTETYSIAQDSGEPANDEDTNVRVMLQYVDSFSCEHESIDTYEEVLVHRAELKEHYTRVNAQTLQSLGLSEADDVTYSDYGPFIEFAYENLDEFMASDYAVMEENNSDLLNKVYVDEMDKESIRYHSQSEPDSGVPFYFDSALRAIGIPDNCSYTGKGIKIGIIDGGFPSSTVNLNGIEYETNTWTESTHAFETSSVLGGTSGIAKGAALYFTRVTNDVTSILSCCDWLINKGVQIINMNAGYSAGQYTADAAYADYIVKNVNVTFVCSAGNGIKDSSGEIIETSRGLASPAMGLNVIAVASSNYYGEISRFSSYLFTAAGMSNSAAGASQAKPTLTAPGDGLTDIKNISGYLNGTSFAAPMVASTIALLMEEFPYLQARPEVVIALLANTCSRVAGQNNFFEKKCGFGLINYQTARESYKGYNGLDALGVINLRSIPSAPYTFSTVAYTVGYQKTFSAVNFLLYNSIQDTPKSSLNYVPYSQLESKLISNKTNTAVKIGTAISNFSYIQYTNTNSPTSYLYDSFKLAITYLSAKQTTGTERIGKHYRIY